MSTKKDNVKDASNYSVMVVDDSFLMRNVIKNIIEKDEAFTIVDEAANGQEAIDKLSSAQPDIILLDIEMPVMDGLEFLQVSRLKTDAKIIVISSVVNIDSPIARKLTSLGAVDMICKPSGVLSVDLEDKKSTEILDAIHRCIEMYA